MYRYFVSHTSILAASDESDEDGGGDKAQPTPPAPVAEHGRERASLFQLSHASNKNSHAFQDIWLKAWGTVHELSVKMPCIEHASGSCSNMRSTSNECGIAWLRR
eukprot:2717837-Pleurochrysis_carterae.AAC.3